LIKPNLDPRDMDIDKATVWTIPTRLPEGMQRPRHQYQGSAHRLPTRNP